MFDELIESSHSPERRRARTVFLSLLVHSVVLAVVLVIPLIYYQGLPRYELLTVLAAPPNPPPPSGPPSLPAPPPPERGKVQIVRLDPDQFMEPTEVPEEIPPPDEEIPMVSIDNWGATGGIPGGDPAGITDGVPNGTAGSVPGRVCRRRTSAPSSTRAKGTSARQQWRPEFAAHPQGRSRLSRAG